MGLRGSIIGSQRIKGGNGFANSGTMRFRLNRIVPSIAIQMATQKPTSSTPEGYRIPLAIVFPIINGGISGKTKIVTDTSSTILGDGYMVGTLTISITTNASGDLLANINGTATITITTSGVITATGYIAGVCEIGASPSADDIAQAVWMSVASSLNIAGTMGNKMNSAASAGDPWSTALPGSYGAGEAGKILADMETLLNKIKALTTAQL